MPNDPFVILGIERGASQSEILEAYKKKREYYQAHVFDEGDAGADAARMLELLDNAYQDAMTYSHEHAAVSGTPDGGDFDLVKTAVREKNIDEAQKLLDDMYYRGAEWHYYQAVVFYEKNWLAESKKQLELAVDLDPSNDKYKRALENMKKKMDGTGAFSSDKAKGESFQSKQAGGQSSSYNPQYDAATERSYRQQQASAADGCCTACQCAICADCCCECMGGDLIRCC